MGQNYGSMDTSPARNLRRFERLPIYLYECPEGHVLEFLKLKKADIPPDACPASVTKVQKSTGRPETFVCGLPLEKIIAPCSWKYTRGKNLAWPLTESVDPTPQGPDEVY